MTDRLTLLRCLSPLRLTKVWQADGEIRPYDEARRFDHTERQVADIHALSALLTAIESRPDVCMIRGRRSDGRNGQVERTKESFEDQALHSILIDIDNYLPVFPDPVREPIEAIQEFVADCLPPAFTGASFHWQLSSSAGKPLPTGERRPLKAHVWFWLATPYTGAQLRAWARSWPAVDRAVFRTVQPLFTAAPVFEPGVVDPVPVRSGFWQGEHDEVDLVLTEAELAAVDAAHVSTLERVKSADPMVGLLYERGMVKSAGRDGTLNVQCPFEAYHDALGGETSTIYRPAHTGGFEHGSFICLHSACEGTKQALFRAAMGLEDPRRPTPSAAGFEPVGEPVTPTTGDPDDPFAGAVTAEPEIAVEAMHLCTDQANAKRLAAAFGTRIMSVAGKWYAWDGRVWSDADAAGTVQRCVGMLSALIANEITGYELELKAAVAESAAEEIERLTAIIKSLRGWSHASEMTRTQSAALAQLSKLASVSPSRLDADPWLLNARNGIVDLRTGELMPHDHRRYMTRMSPVDYDPAREAATWRRAISEIFGGDQTVVDFAQRWFGYSATGLVREHALVVHWGDGANGKSTVLETLMKVLGDYSAGVAPKLLIATKGDRHPTEIANLFGRRMVTTSETGEGAALNEELVKQLTGGDTLTARFMRGDFFDFAPTHKLQMLTNHKPAIRGSDHGIWRRVMLLPYAETFGETVGGVHSASGRLITRKADTRLGETIAAEHPGILAWVVAGAVAWNRDGLRPPERVRGATATYREEQDRTGEFVAECCEIDQQATYPLSDAVSGGLYDAYVIWAKSAGYHPLGRQRFVESIARHVPGGRVEAEMRGGRTERRRRVQMMHGVRLL